MRNPLRFINVDFFLQNMRYLVSYIITVNSYTSFGTTSITKIYNIKYTYMGYFAILIV